MKTQFAGKILSTMLNHEYNDYKHSPTFHIWHCCHAIETNYTQTANPPNSAQLEGTPTIPSSYIVWCSSVGMWWGIDRQTIRLTCYASSEM